MSESKRLVLLDVLMICWGLGTWLGVNGIFVQLPLLVQQLPEGWALPSSMVMAIQLANIGMVTYVILRKLFPRAPEGPYIYTLLSIGTLALFLNSFLHTETVMIGGSERSISFLALTFFTGLVGCTSSVLFYPHMRHFRDIYLATYLVGEGLSGFIPGILSLIQGVGGEPECVYGPNSTVEVLPPQPRFDSTLFLILLGCLSALSLVSFSLVDNLSIFDTERVKPSEAVKQDEATTTDEPVLQPRWIAMLVLMAFLNALNNGVLPSVQSFSCMPYGANVYHLAVTLGAMANPTACLAGVWLRPVSARVLCAMLAVMLVPLAYILSTAVLSPTPPLHTETIGKVLVVFAWVCVSAVLSYARMWIYGWARRGGAAGMRVVGVITQIGSATGSLTLFFIVNYTGIFEEPPRCPIALI